VPNFLLTAKGGVVLNTDDNASRRMVEQCFRTRKTMVNPIIDWSDDEVWEFLKYYKVSGNPLYSQGCKRVGCVGCPMSTHRKMEIEKYPKFKNAYIKSFQYMIESDGYKGQFKCGQDVYDWWVGDKKNSKKSEDQMLLFGDEYI